MINFEFSNTTEIVFGKGTQEQVGEKIRKYSDCNKVLVVYGSDRIKKNGLFDAVSSSLKQQKMKMKMRAWSEYLLITRISFVLSCTALVLAIARLLLK